MRASVSSATRSFGRTADIVRFLSVGARCMCSRASPGAEREASAEGTFRIVLEDDLLVVCGDDAASRVRRYRSDVQGALTRIRPHAVEALVVVFAVASMVEPFIIDGVAHPVAD